MGSCCGKKQAAVIQPVPNNAEKNQSQYSDTESADGSIDRGRGSRRRKKSRRRRRSPDDSQYADSDNDSPRPSKFSSSRGNKRHGRSTSTDPYITSDPQYAQDKGRLQQIADDMLAHPPQPLLHSKSYNNSVKVYEEKLKAAHNEEYLDSVYEGEVEKLQNSALVKPFKSANSKMPTADNEETTRHAQISEYRLQIGALVNCYMKRRQELLNLRYLRDEQRNKDLNFLENLKTLIKTEQLPHEDVVRRLNDYTRYDENNINV